MQENKYCPCCGRHCDLSEPHCERGENYARTGVIERGHEHHHDKRKIFAAENYNKLNTDNKLIMNLRDLGHTLHSLSEGKGSQKRILIILHENGGMTQRELTERLGIQPGSASEVIGKLEKAGLIQRTESMADRRTADIQLTQTGKTLAEEAAGQRRTRYREMFSSLSDEEKLSLLALLEKLRADWDGRYPKRAGHHGERGKGGPHGHHEHHGHHGDI
ncbi:MAG: MarR family winged helix-turn-helix transcriptional regulator [Candidatus Ornithomonoglobus sp.]